MASLSSIAIALGIVLPRVTRGPTLQDDRVASMLFAIGASMLTFTALVFSLLFLVVQWGTTTFTPRLNLFRDDPLVWHAFGAIEQSYSAVGQVIHYTIVATNDGNVTLSGVTVSDPSVSGLSCTPANGSSLAPGGSMTCTATHTIVQADLDAGHYANTACVDDGPGNAAQACANEDVPRVAVCSVVSSISSNFNGTRISAGDYIWFNSVLSVSGLGSQPVTITLTGSTVQSNAFSLSVPNARITFDPTATVATTTFDVPTNTWITIVPTQGTGNVLLSGLAFLVPQGGLAGGLNPVTWAGTLSSDTPGVKISWKWAAAVYNSFSTDYNALQVKPVDTNSLSAYKNSDHAGTPEAYKNFVTGGARGGGGSNFTGSYSGTTKAVCP
jgi:uncharacterized repeat protein (TIGR01451 family)